VYLYNYSKLALPLTELTKGSKSNKIAFNEEQRAAFLKSKETLCNYVTLHSVDFSKPFHLFVDASQHSVAGALTQKAEGQDSTFLPIAFASAKLSECHRSW